MTVPHDPQVVEPVKALRQEMTPEWILIATCPPDNAGSDEGQTTPIRILEARFGSLPGQQRDNCLEVLNI